MLPQYVVDKLILFTFAIQTEYTYLTDTNNNMSNSFLTPPIPKNEPVKSYGPKSTEKREIKAMLKKLKKEKRDIPMFIGGK
ncbi:MAG TPA: hypothetical protein DCW83_12290, partial [Saprospirales bacterium]|nr:hypothetical protein [Saprospirales bacterium]